MVPNLGLQPLKATRTTEFLLKGSDDSDGMPFKVLIISFKALKSERSTTLPKKNAFP